MTRVRFQRRPFTEKSREVRILLEVARERQPVGPPARSDGEEKTHPADGCLVLVLRVRWDSGNMLTQSRDFEDEKGALRTRAR